MKLTNSFIVAMDITSQPDKRKKPGGNGPSIGGFHFLLVFVVLRSLLFNGLELLDELKIGFFTFGDAPVLATVANAAGRNNDDPDSTDISDSFVAFNDLFGVDPGLSSSLRSFSFCRFKNASSQKKNVLLLP